MNRFKLSNKLLGDLSTQSAEKNSELYIAAELSFFGVLFRGSFERNREGVSALLGLGTDDRNSKFSITKIPLIRSISKVNSLNIFLQALEVLDFAPSFHYRVNLVRVLFFFSSTTC